MRHGFGQRVFCLMIVGRFRFPIDRLALMLQGKPISEFS